MAKTWADRVLYLGAFLVCFGIYLLVARGEAVNGKQFWFRVGVTGAGVVMGMVGVVLKASGRGTDAGKGG